MSTIEIADPFPITWYICDEDVERYKEFFTDVPTTLDPNILMDSMYDNEFRHFNEMMFGKMDDSDNVSELAEKVMEKIGEFSVEAQMVHNCGDYYKDRYKNFRQVLKFLLTVLDIYVLGEASNFATNFRGIQVSSPLVGKEDMSKEIKIDKRFEVKYLGKE